jgi:hypothetical protein
VHRMLLIQLLCLTNTKTGSNLLVHRMLLIQLPFAKDLRTAKQLKKLTLP